MYYNQKKNPEKLKTKMEKSLVFENEYFLKSLSTKRKWIICECT